MTMNEKKTETIEKEITKITVSIEKCENTLVKKTAQCIKLNCNWTNEEYNEIIEQLHARHKGEDIVYLGNDDDLITEKQKGAYFDKRIAERALEEYKERLEKAETRYAKAIELVRAENEKNEELRKAYEQATEMERKMLEEKAEKEYNDWLIWFKAECLKDGIIVDKASNNYVIGTTPTGKHFCFQINNGYTKRSLHCYSLDIDGKTIFTSGDFYRCYSKVKNN